MGGGGIGQRNVIAGNTSEDVLVDSENADGNTVAGNYVGVDAIGFLAVPSPSGTSIRVSIVNGADNNVVGGSFRCRQCYIGIQRRKLRLRGATGGIATTGNVVAGNFIGTDASGLLARPSRAGVNLNAHLNFVGWVHDGGAKRRWR